MSCVSLVLPFLGPPISYPPRTPHAAILPLKQVVHALGNVTCCKSSWLSSSVALHLSEASRFTHLRMKSLQTSEMSGGSGGVSCDKPILTSACIWCSNLPQGPMAVPISIATHPKLQMSAAR